MNKYEIQYEFNLFFDKSKNIIVRNCTIVYRVKTI